ncbi:hypothetical protein Bbelb_013870 [Branchiostoma belcheri]|nr:hypothetical protein Bbelb_013870 [Branchiostoma belcheri]
MPYDALLQDGGEGWEMIELMLLTLGPVARSREENLAGNIPSSNTARVRRTHGTDDQRVYGSQADKVLTGLMAGLSPPATEPGDCDPGLTAFNLYCLDHVCQV